MSGKMISRSIFLLVTIAVAISAAATYRHIHPHLTYLFVFYLSGALGYLITPAMRRLSFRIGALDLPGLRKNHHRPTPLLGGLGIFLAIGITLVYARLCLALNGVYSPEADSFCTQLTGILWAGALLVAIGVVDDIRGLSAFLRLFGQLAAAVIAILHGVRLSFLPATWWGNALEVTLTIFWFVGMTNAMNFLDGIDGLAAGVAAVAAAAFFTIALLTQQIYLGLIAVAVAGASLAFLRYNFRPASIFLGDAGSTFLGFTLAGIGVMGSWAEQEGVYALSIPVLILSVLIYDVIFVTIARVHNGSVRNLRAWVEYVGHDHLHHRLLNLGLTVPQTCFFVYLLCTFAGLGAVVMKTGEVTDKWLILAMAVIMMVILTVLMEAGKRGRPVRPTNEGPPETKPLGRIVSPSGAAVPADTTEAGPTATPSSGVDGPSRY